MCRLLRCQQDGATLIEFRTNEEYKMLRRMQGENCNIIMYMCTENELIFMQIMQITRAQNTSTCGLASPLRGRSSAGPPKLARTNSPGYRTAPTTTTFPHNSNTSKSRMKIISAYSIRNRRRLTAPTATRRRRRSPANTPATGPEEVKTKKPEMLHALPKPP